MLFGAISPFRSRTFSWGDMSVLRLQNPTVLHCFTCNLLRYHCQNSLNHHPTASYPLVTRSREKSSFSKTYEIFSFFWGGIFSSSLKVDFHRKVLHFSVKISKKIVFLTSTPLLRTFETNFSFSIFTTFWILFDISEDRLTRFVALTSVSKMCYSSLPSQF